MRERCTVPAAKMHHAVRGAAGLEEGALGEGAAPLANRTRHAVSHHALKCSVAAHVITRLLRCVLHSAEGS